RPAHAARRDHRGRERDAGRAAAGRGAAARAGCDRARRGPAPQPPGRQPARHDAARGRDARAEARLALARGADRLRGRAARRARFAAEIAADLPLVPIDAVLVEQALVNLLENAVRHGGAAGAVRVAARRDGDCALVEVSDAAPGVAPGDEERVFDKFYTTA